MTRQETSFRFSWPQLTVLAFAALVLLPLLPIVGGASSVLVGSGIVLLGLAGLWQRRVVLTVPVLGSLLYSGYLLLQHSWWHAGASNQGSLLTLLLGQAVLLLAMQVGQGFPFRGLYLAVQAALTGLVLYVTPIYFRNYGLLDLPTIRFGVLGGTSEVAQLCSLLLVLLLLLRQLHGLRFRSDWLVLGLGIALLLLLKSRTGLLTLGAFGLVMQLALFRRYRFLWLGLLALPLLYFVKPASVSGRTQLWAYSLGHLDGAAVAGAGLDNFGAFFHRAILDDVQQGTYVEATIASIGEVNYLAFNDFVQVLIEQGLPGLILLLLPMGWIVWRSIRERLSLALPAACAAISVLMFFLFPVHAPATTWILCLTWGIGLAALPDPPVVLPKRTFSPLLLLPAFLLLAAMSYQHVRRDAKWGAATHLLPAPGRPDARADAAYAELYPELGHRAGFLYEYGKLEINSGRPEQAIPHFQGAVDRYPGYDQLLSLADACEAAGQFSAAQAHYLSASHLRPFTLYPRYRHFLLEMQNGNLPSACSLGAAILAMPLRGDPELGTRMQADVRQRMAKFCDSAK